MKKIILDGKEVTHLVPESLPMLIHGEKGSGASLYTISLAAQWASQRYEINFLCGYDRAETAFKQQVGTIPGNVHFYTQEQVPYFIDSLHQKDFEKTIIFIKNIELFDSGVFEAVIHIKHLIVSGDVSKTKYKSDIMKLAFTTSIYFSEMEGIDLPVMDPYQGVVHSADFQGITYLE